MDFTLNEKLLPPPINITVNSMRRVSQLLVVWDKMKNPDEKKIDNDPSLNDGLILKVKYNVYRSTSLNGMYYKLNKDPLTEPRYEDNSIGKNTHSQYFYKVSTVVEIAGTGNVEGKLSNAIIYRVTTTNKWFIKINERNMWILKNTGVLMDLYIRKTDGPRCSHCYDPIRLQGLADCTFCFGTTFEGGYEPATQLYVRQKPAVQQLDLSTYGYSQSSNPGAWTIADIKISNRDLLINPEGKIFSVTNSNIGHASGYLFHQELSMKELDSTDKRHNIKRATLYPNW